MMVIDQYRCCFLDSTGRIGSHETIDCVDERDAVAVAREMLERRPHYLGVELWKGARRIHLEVRMPEVPAFVIRATQRC